MNSGLVYVVDDDADLAGSVSRLLRRNAYSAEPFLDPEALLDSFSREAAHCVLSDIMMPQMNGFEFAQALKRIDSSVAVIFMTAWPSVEAAVEALKVQGGLDYLAKPLREDKLLAAVEDAVSWSKGIRTKRERLGRLSAREEEVFDLLVRGYANKQVAVELSISIRTVEDHRASIMRKTGAKNLAELMALAGMERSLLTPILQQQTASGSFMSAGRPKHI